MKLTRHFEERWAERIGTPVPAPGEVEEMKNDAIFIQRSRDLFTPTGRRYRILALYWLPQENLILKIDERRNVAVTIITPETAAEEGV